MNFHKGQKVNTPLGEGVVNYQRMAPPTYAKAEAVSVILDSRKKELGFCYSGTIFPAEKVETLEG